MPIRVEHKKINGIEYKWCSFHEDWHTLDKFGKLSKAWDSLRSKCKDSRTGSYKRTTDYKSVEEKHNLNFFK